MPVDLMAEQHKQANPESEDSPAPQWQADPFPLMAITLGAGKDSPKMTLFRSNRYNQMAIRFDEPPAKEHRERLRQEQWRWREAEGVWTKRLDRDRRATSQMEAERLFTDIGNAIRNELGLSGRSDVGS